MSSPELQRGLLATCVASRCSVLLNPEDRELVWFLQRLSHLPGGLEKVATEILALWPERFVTTVMAGLGIGKNRHYRPAETAEVFESIAANPCLAEACRDERSAFQYKLYFGNVPKDYVQSLAGGDEVRPDFDPETFADDIAAERARFFESDVPASLFVTLCKDAALGKVEATCSLADFLFKRVCLDPILTPGDWAAWYLPDLHSTLREYRDWWIETNSRGLAMTEVTEKLFEALDYARDVRGLVLVQGAERRGKTFSSKAWCDLHPGEARYVKTPSTSDDIGFFREIAQSLGIGCGQSLKTVQLRERIEDVLSNGDLMLVFDNAHNLFRQSMYRNAIPHRLTWILTELVDEGIPVAFVATPQFTISQQLTVERSKWRDGQLTGRIKHFEQLPAKLTKEDLEKVARAYLPKAEPESIEFLVTYAQASTKYLQAIESLSQRAQYLAKKEGREYPLVDDLKAALVSAVIPSDRAIAEATDAAEACVRPRAGRRGPSTASKVRLMHSGQDRGQGPTPALLPDQNFSRTHSNAAKDVAETLA